MIMDLRYSPKLHVTVIGIKGAWIKGYNVFLDAICRNGNFKWDTEMSNAYVWDSHTIYVLSTEKAQNLKSTAICLILDHRYCLFRKEDWRQTMINLLLPVASNQRNNPAILLQTALFNEPTKKKKRVH